MTYQYLHDHLPSELCVETHPPVIWMGKTRLGWVQIYIYIYTDCVSYAMKMGVNYVSSLSHVIHILTGLYVMRVIMHVSIRRKQLSRIKPC